jgi:hypothetical protein
MSGECENEWAEKSKLSHIYRLFSVLQCYRLKLFTVSPCCRTQFLFFRRNMSVVSKSLLNGGGGAAKPVLSPVHVFSPGTIRTERRQSGDRNSCNVSERISGQCQAVYMQPTREGRGDQEFKNQFLAVKGEVPVSCRQIRELRYSSTILSCCWTTNTISIQISTVRNATG